MTSAEPRCWLIMAQLLGSTFSSAASRAGGRHASFPREPSIGIRLMLEPMTPSGVSSC